MLKWFESDVNEFVGKELDKLLAKAGARIEAQAKVNQSPHIRTGFLNSTIQAQPAERHEVAVSVGAEYALWHELKYPYLYPALLQCVGRLG